MSFYSECVVLQRGSREPSHRGGCSNWAGWEGLRVTRGVMRCWLFDRGGVAEVSSCFLPRVAYVLSVILSCLGLPTQTFAYQVCVPVLFKSEHHSEQRARTIFNRLPPCQTGNQERASLADDFHIFKSSAFELNRTTKIKTKPKPNTHTHPPNPETTQPSQTKKKNPKNFCINHRAQIKLL